MSISEDISGESSPKEWRPVQGTGQAKKKADLPSEDIWEDFFKLVEETQAFKPEEREAKRAFLKMNKEGNIERIKKSLEEFDKTANKTEFLRKIQTITDLGYTRLQKIVDDDEKRKALFSLFTESPAAGVEEAALEKEARARKVAGGQRIQESGQVWTGTGVAQSLDDNMAVALLCSRYIKDTPFEGGLFLHISWVFDRLFDQVERWPLRLGKGTGHDELRRQVARMHELEDNILNQQASTVLSEISQALLNGDSVFLPGGFSGSEGELGHVMAYSISDGYFRIYNTGAGIQYHPGINSPGRNKYDSVLEYKLPPDGIFVDTEGQRSLYPEFEELLLGFMDIRTGNISGDENILYAVIDICMENLGATKSQKISNPSNLTTSQPSGVCATQVFFPIARELVGEDYKFLAIDMRLVALNEFLPRLRKDPGNIAYQKICQEGVRKIAGRLLKQFPTVDSIPPELREKVQQIHRFLDDVRMEVDEISVQQTSSHILPIPEGNASTTVPLGEPIVMKKALPVSTSAEVQASTSLVEEVGVPDLSKGSEGILSWLKQLNTLATRAYDSGDIKTALYYAGEAIRQLPVPKDDYRSDSVWGPTLGEKNALEAMDLLSSLHEMLAGSIDYIRSDSPYGETSLYIVQTYAICYQLARGLMRESSDPERSWLENVSIPTSWPQIFVDRMIGVSSRELLEKREQLTHYLTSTMSSGEYELFGTDRNVFDTSFTFDRCTKRERPKMGGQLLDWTKSPTPSPVSRLFHIGSSIEKLNPDRARPIKIEKSDIYGMGDDNISGNLFLAGSYDEKWHERGSPASELIRRLGSYCSEKEIGLGDIASFFLSEPGAFKELESEPLQNFQALLIRLVNKGADGLSNELVANPACAQNWLELADRGWKRALQPPQNIANALFFFHIRERVLSALEGIDDAKRPLYTNEQIQGLRRRSYEELMQLATTHPPPKTEELAAIHREILCMQDRVEWTGISGKTSEEKLEWLERVLPSLCMLNLHSAIGVFANIKMLDIEARHFRRLAAQPIITRLLDEPRAIEKYGGALTSCVVQAFGVKTEDVGDWKQIGPGLWRAGKYTIEPATGNLYEEGESVCSLPRNVIDGCDPPWIFGEEQPLARVLAQGRGYEWTSRFGGIERTFRAIKESRGAGFQLQMFGGGERGWLKLTSLGKKEMESLAEHSPLLAESGSFYYWTSDSTLVFTDKSGCHYAEWFASSAEQPEWCIRKLEADGTRTNWLLDCGFAGRMAYASTLDRAEYTHHWIDGKGGEELDYTRMAGMTWEKQKSGEWSCDLDGVPMRLITEKEEIPKVNLSFPHMLFAKGAKGSQKRYAFICEGAFMECPKGEQQLFPQRADRTPLAWDEQSEQHGFPSMGSRGYYRFDIEPDGSLSSNTVEGNLFLLYLALGEGNHEQALRYLKACGHPSYLSQEAWSLAHKVIVDSEETIKDHTPEASALVLQLYDWLKLIASKPLKSGLQEQTEQSTRESSHALVDAEYRKARSLDACSYFFDFLPGQGIFPNEVVSSAALERVLGGMEGVESSIAERENDYIESLRYQRPPFALDQDQMMRLGMTWPMEEVCEPDLTTEVEGLTGTGTILSFVPKPKPEKRKDFYSAIQKKSCPRLIPLRRGDWKPDELPPFFIELYRKLTSDKTELRERTGLIRGFRQLKEPERSTPEWSLWAIINYVLTLPNPNRELATERIDYRISQLDPDPFKRASRLCLSTIDKWKIDKIFGQPANANAWCLTYDMHAITLQIAFQGTRSPPMELLPDAKTGGYLLPIDEDTTVQFKNLDAIQEWLNKTYGRQLKPLKLDTSSPPPWPFEKERMTSKELRMFFMHPFFSSVELPLGLQGDFVGTEDVYVRGRVNFRNYKAVLYNREAAKRLTVAEPSRGEKPWESKTLFSGTPWEDFDFTYPMGNVFEGVLSTEGIRALERKPSTADLEAITPSLFDDQKSLVDSKRLDADFVRNELDRMSSELSQGQRINGENQAAMKQKHAIIASNSSKLLEAREGLSVRSKTLKEDLQRLQNNIIKDANTPENPEILLEVQRRRCAGVRPDLNWADLTNLYLRHDFDLWQERTGLSLPAIHDLDKKMTQYLLLQSQSKQMDRVVRKLDLLKKRDKLDAEIVREAMNAIGHECSVRRAYSLDSSHFRAFLVFEAAEGASDFLLRSDQIKIIEDLIQNPDTRLFRSAIKKMIMGGGKSKVLLPLLSLMRADGQHLVVNTVPRELYQTNISDLYESSKHLFNQTAQPFTFHPELVYSPRQLRDMRMHLEAVIRNRDYLIVDDQSIPSMELCFLLWCHQAKARKPPKKELLNKIDEMRKILKIFADNGVNLIDEVHRVLYVRQEINIPLGRPTAICSHRAQAMTTVFDLLDDLSLETGKPVDEDTRSKSFALLAGDNIYFPPSEEAKKAIQEQLSHRVLEASFSVSLLDGQVVRLTLSEHLAKSGLRGSDLQKAFVDYVMGLETPKKKRLESYLDTLHSAGKSTLDYQVTQLVGALKENIADRIPFLISNQVHEKFGLSKENPFNPVPIPYEAANKPKEGSEFLPDESLGYAAIYYRAADIPRIQVEQYLRAIGEAIEEQALERNIPEEETEIYRLFIERFGKKPVDFLGGGIESLELFASLINKKKGQSKELLGDFLNKVVVPRIVEYEGKVWSTAASQYAIYHSGSGMSGTPDSTYHQELEADIVEGIDGITMDHLISHGGEILPVAPTTRKTSDAVGQLFATFHKRQEKTPLNALIDVGAQYKEYSHRAISEQIMNYYQQTEEYGIRGVLYFDDATNRLHALLENGNSVDIGTTDPDVIQKKTGLTPRELFTFYDQSHTTGIDIRQEMQANAIITISETTPCSHLLQGAMRMRELGKLQRVHYALNESLLDREGKFPNVRDLLVRTIVNEATKRGGGHWKSAQDQMDNVLRRSILEEILDTKGVQEVIDKVDEGGEVFFQDTTTDLYLRSKAPKIPRDSKKMLAERRDQLEQTKDRIAQRKRYRDVGTALSRSCQDGWDKVFGRLYPEDGASLIPEKIIASGEQGITLDVQSRQQQEMELDREKQIASVTVGTSVQEREIKRSDVRESTIREGKFVDNSDLLSKKWRPLFSEEPCFFVTNHFAEQLVSPVPDQMWGIATQMLVSKTPDGQYRLTVLHGYEAEYYAKKIQESDEDLWLVDVAGNFVRKPKEPAPDLTDSGLVAQLQQIQLFQGRLGLIMKSKNPPEWLVKTYTREPELFRAFLKECVFPNFPIAKEAEKRFLRWLISKSKA